MARELGLDHKTRPQFLAELLNSARRSVAVGGTSGKSTVTAMVGWILHVCHRQPTVMNGAVMKNFVPSDAPFASALVGDPELFVSEVDESDGSIALYRPSVAVLGNISLDHKEMDELRLLFGGFLAAAGKAVVNLDDAPTGASTREPDLVVPRNGMAEAITEACGPGAADFVEAGDLAAMFSGCGFPVRLPPAQEQGMAALFSISLVPAED